MSELERLINRELKELGIDLTEELPHERAEQIKGELQVGLYPPTEYEASLWKKVYFDTNVLIDALEKDAPERALKIVQELKLEAWTSEITLAELIGKGFSLMRAVEEGGVKVACLIQYKEKMKSYWDTHKDKIQMIQGKGATIDRYQLLLALVLGCDVFITQDRDFDPLKSSMWRAIRVIEPKDFVKLYERRVSSF